MNLPATSLLGTARNARARNSACIVTLLALLFVAPPAGIAQQQSSIEAEVAPNQFQFCGGITEAGTLSSIHTSPASPAVSEQVMFRIRKNSIGTESETLHLDSILFGPSASGPFQSRTTSQVSFSSNPSLPQFFSDGGQDTFSMSFVPRESGLYRFTFFSQLWDGGSCSVDIQVESANCLIDTIDGVGPSGGPMPNLLDFGTSPVGVPVTGTLQFQFTEPFPGQEGIAFTTVEIPAFDVAPGFFLSPSGEEADWEVTFTPDAPGAFEDIVGFVAVRDQEKQECFVDIRFLGLGEGGGGTPEISILFDDPVCGDDLEITAVIRNDGTSPITNLDANAPAGYSLTPLPAGSFDVNNFSLESQDSSNSERRFLLRVDDELGSAEQFLTVEQSGEILAQGSIPQAACIRIVEPGNLTLNFGDVVVDNAAPSQSILVANRGNASATVAGTLAGSGLEQGFGLGLDESATANLNLPAGAEESLPVSFTPPGLGPRMSTVDFTSSVFPEIPSVNLVGNGVDQPTPSLSFDVNGMPVNPGGTIRFPATQLGEVSSLPLTITNSGNLGALGIGLNAVNGEFDVSGAAPAELAPQQSASFTLTFGPQAAGARSGQLMVTSENLPPLLFVLTGEGVMGELSVNGIGLNTTVVPAQDPVPTVGLELQGGGASQTMVGDLMIEFVPNLPQTPAGFVDAYQQVRFMAGGGANGRTIAVRFDEGEQRALFPDEGAGAQEAGYQSGTVAGTIQFRLMNVRTLEGAPVPVTNPLVGSVTVERLAPSIRSMTTPQTSTGINVVVGAVSTPREITGVCLSLTAAPDTDLSFTRPDAAFLNEPFLQWFNGSDSFPHGGDFQLTIPIDISDMRVFGSAQVWLLNSVGWSAPGSPCQ